MAGPSCGEGLVFNIQSFCLHDGPGIRTMVFLKGCPLRCRWCSNPESQENRPEPGLNTGRCLGQDKCRLCLAACSHGAAGSRSWGGREYPHLDRAICRPCPDFACRKSCPAGALTVYGEYLAAGEVIGRIQREGVLFQRSGGGLTVSGGEPLNQPEFLLRLLAEAKKSGSGPPWRLLAMAALKYWPQAAGYLETILYGVKTVDPLRHRQFTGADNELILRNLLRLAESCPKPDLTVRTPVIPWTDLGLAV